MTAVADYAGNPYPGQLFNHYTGGPDDGDHAVDWDDQPAPYADGHEDVDPAHPARWWRHPDHARLHRGEHRREQNLTITLEDVYGNPIEGRQVEWFMQGVGFFVTDDDDTISDPTDPAGNKDFDVTDADGKARLMVKSYDAGEQIVHAKVRDKGIGGTEGSFTTYDAEVQWFDVNVVTFDDPTTSDNEAVSTNAVGTTHDFTLWVKGLKLELDPNIDDPAAQTPYIDTDAAGRRLRRHHRLPRRRLPRRHPAGQCPSRRRCDRHVDGLVVETATTVDNGYWRHRSGSRADSSACQRWLSPSSTGTTTATRNPSPARRASTCPSRQGRLLRPRQRPRHPW